MVPETHAPEAPEVNPSHFLPSEVVTEPKRFGRWGREAAGQPTSSLPYKVKALSQICHKLDTIKVRSKVEGGLLVNLIQAMLDEADADGIDPALRQKYYSAVSDATLRVHELHAKAAADCLDLETKRSDTRLKRQMWKDKQGIGKLVNASVDPGGIAEVAELIRKAQP